MDYALAHALLGVSYVAKLNNDGPPEILRLTSEAAKEEFFLTTLGKGDRLFTELGGANDKVALIAVARGAEVSRIPTFRIGNKDAVLETVSAADWPVSEERAHGGETSDALTARKARAIAIGVRSVLTPEDFLPTRDDNATILRIQHLYRKYRSFQKVLLASYQRLVSVYNDDYLLEIASQQNADRVKGGDLTKGAVTKVINDLLSYVPEEEREALIAKLGIEKIKAAGVKRSQMGKIFKAIIDEMMQGGATAPFLREMKATYKQLEKELKTLSVFQNVFKPIPGCGPLIAARWIASIGDIRRFRAVKNLRAYAGYHHFEDGSRARRRAGRVSNWKVELKQGIYLLCQSTLKMPKSPFRAKLDLRRSYELYKLLVQRQRMADEQEVTEQILPEAYRDRSIACVNDMKPEDLAILAAHVDALRKKAGVKTSFTDDEEDDEEEKIAARDPKLAKLVRGLKQNALDKAMRWLGQYFIKHVYKSWRRDLALSDFPARSTSAPDQAAEAPPIAPAPRVSNETQLDASASA